MRLGCAAHRNAPNPARIGPFRHPPPAQGQGRAGPCRPFARRRRFGMKPPNKAAPDPVVMRRFRGSQYLKLVAFEAKVMAGIEPATPRL